MCVCVYTTGSSLYHCLPWSQAARPGKATEITSSPCCLCRPVVLTRTTQLSMLWTPVAWAKEIACPFWTLYCHMPHTWHPIPLEPRLQHDPACSHSKVKGFPYQSQSITSGRCCFSKYVDTYARLQGSWVREMSPPKEYNRPPVNGDPEITQRRIQNNCSTDALKATRKQINNFNLSGKQQENKSSI